MQLDKILGAQAPKSATPEKPQGEHDEMLFLIIHQTFELWFKQVLFELRDVVAMFQQPVLRETESTRVLHHLSRVCEILKVSRNEHAPPRASSAHLTSVNARAVAYQPV